MRKVKLIIHETYQGKRKSEDVNAAVFLSDIIALLDRWGNCVVEYTYDAWGKVLSVTGSMAGSVGKDNPLRYRGYYYDRETGLYYLQSRYYDPVTGRFINADDTTLLGVSGTIVSYNLFAYCDNNPINKKDVDGYIAANVVGAAIGAVIGIVGGIFLGNWLADIIKLSGWKRGLFVGGVAALVGATAAAIGYFIGPYVAKIAVKLGQYIANLVRKGKIAFKKLSSNVKASLRSLFKETCCFIAGTRISTPTGEKTIENIAVGDSVYAVNPETGEMGVKKVSRTFKKQTSTLYHVVTANEEIVTTDEHPFWVNGRGWVVARELAPGNALCLQDGKTAEIINVFVEQLSSPVFVYNFEVEDWHTYFVGSDKILVHNKCSLTKIKDSYLKQNGLDAHAIKYEVLGKNAKISQYNLFYDKTTKAIFILANGANEAAKIATGYFLK